MSDAYEYRSIISDSTWGLLEIIPPPQNNLPLFTTDVLNIIPSNLEKENVMSEHIEKNISRSSSFRSSNISESMDMYLTDRGSRFTNKSTQLLVGFH